MTALTIINIVFDKVNNHGSHSADDNNDAKTTPFFLKPTSRVPRVPSKTGLVLRGGLMLALKCNRCVSFGGEST